MRTYLLFFSCIFTCLALSQCKSTSANKTDSLKNEALTKLGKQKYGNDAVYVESPAKSYVLCYKEKKGSVQNPKNKIEYFVFATKNNQTVYSNSVEGGYVKWYSDYQLEIFLTPGIMPRNKSKDDFISIYNLRDKTSTRKSAITGGSKD